MSGTHVGAVDARLSPDGTTLYVVEDGAAAAGAAGFGIVAT